MTAGQAPIQVARPIIGAEEEAAVLRVLRSGHLASGPEVASFEQAFAAAADAAHAVAVTNGTVAIQAALEALGIGKGDEVLVPAFTFVATANAVLYAGATPVFVDIDPQTFCMDAAAAQAACTPRTKAMLPVHLYGLPADLDRLGAVCHEHGLALLGDAAQAHGATWRGRQVGGMGDAATWSLYPTKNITSGEGGMVTTDDAALAARIRSIANHGRARAEHGVYEHVRAGTNFRMSDLHAAIGRVQLGRLPGWLEARTENAARLSAALEGHRLIQCPVVPSGAGHAWHQYTVLCDQRERLRQHLADRGVGSAVYYPKTLETYAHLAPFARAACPNAAHVRDRCLSVPVHPGLTREEMDQVVDALMSFR